MPGNVACFVSELVPKAGIDYKTVCVACLLNYCYFHAQNAATESLNEYNGLVCRSRDGNWIDNVQVGQPYYWTGIGLLNNWRESWWKPMMLSRVVSIDALKYHPRILIRGT